MAGLGRMGRGAFAGLTLALLLVSPADAAERKLLVTSFENIFVIGDIDVVVQTGKPVSAKASGDRRVLDSLKLERTGNTLRIRVLDLLNNEKGKPIIEPLRVILSTPMIQKVVVSGNGVVSVSAIKQTEAAEILISGGGKVTVGNVVATQFNADIDGNGQIDIGGGAVRNSRVTIIGAGEYRGAKLQTRKLRLEHNGNARSAATVAEGTDIYNRGSGNIDIGGNGTCFIKLAGRAAINCAKIDGEGKNK
jgi:Putative auto-transporter adhesin, head GIN domain